MHYETIEYVHMTNSEVHLNMVSAALSGWEVTWCVIFLLLKYFVIHKSSAFPPVSISSPELGALGPSRQLALPGLKWQIPPGQWWWEQRGHSLWGHGGVLPAQHPVGGFTGAAQAAQEGLQLDQTADTRGVYEPHALPHSPHSPPGPDRALGQQSLGLHRHSC